jgi:hypothetical protein
MMKKMMFAALVMTAPAIASANGLPEMLNCRDKASFEAEKPTYPAYAVAIAFPANVRGKSPQSGSLTLKSTELSWLMQAKMGAPVVEVRNIKMIGQISLGAVKNELDFGQAKVFLKDWGHDHDSHQNTFLKVSIQFGNEPEIPLTCVNA